MTQSKSKRYGGQSPSPLEEVERELRYWRQLVEAMDAILLAYRGCKKPSRVRLSQANIARAKLVAMGRIEEP